mgnify:CR=1 FL=1
MAQGGARPSVRRSARWAGERAATAYGDACPQIGSAMVGGRWALDVVGDASYFFPTFGEASDLAFAFVYSFAVDLLFDWPAMALFAFWEEALPITDLVPTATIAWVLVVTGVRTMLRDRAEADRETEIDARH